MAKHFTIIDNKSQITADFAKNKYTEVMSIINNASGCLGDTEFLIKGIKATLQEVISEIDKLNREWFAKKNETHKQIIIPMGVTPFAKPLVKWVRK